MPSLVVIGQQIKEKWRGTQCPPSLYYNKLPHPEYVKDQYTPCDLYHTIFLYYYAETKEIINDIFLTSR